MSDLTMTNTQEAAVALKITDKNGNPATVDGIPEWRSSDESIVTAVINPKDATGKTCVARASGLLGEADIVVTCDADLGTGVKPLVGQLHVIITGGGAEVIELTAGEPAEQGTEGGPPEVDAGLPPHAATLPDGPSAQPRRR